MSNGDVCAVLVNTRTLRSDATGVQRYITEIVERLGPRVKCVRPFRGLYGAKGHLWEQFFLPLKVGGNLLWSPAGTGPYVIRRQVLTVTDAAPPDHPKCSTRTSARGYRSLLPHPNARTRRRIPTPKSPTTASTN